MIKRRKLMLTLGAMSLYPSSAWPQQPVRMARIGILGATSASGFATRWEALRAGLRELGYIEGKNISIDYRWADGKFERLPELAKELVNLKIDVLITHGIPGTTAAKRATATIPIVMATVTDPVATGLVANLAQPGGNVTGMAFFAPELSAKRLELLKETNPRVAQVAVLLNPDNPMFSQTMLKAMEVTAKALNLRLYPFEARASSDYDAVISAIANQRVDALAVLEEITLNANAAVISTSAKKYQLKSIGNKEFAEAGGLIGYGANSHDLFRRAGGLVAKILKGAKPGELPVEQATTFELVVNMKTANLLGIKIPNPILLQATKILD
jgi:putative ABC transport system substrate-binding protein